MNLNQQPVERYVDRSDGSLDVHSIFPTIQGEGPDAGTPAVFVRLAGCNLSATCKLCDTDYTSKRKLMTLLELETAVSPLLMSRRLVVFTGGEPFRQNLRGAVSLLSHSRLQCRIQIETNGTFPIGFNTGILGSIVCSPKTPKVHPEIEYWADAFKYVVEAEHIDPKDGLPTRALGGLRPARPSLKDFRGDIFLQPCDEKNPVKNKANVQAALDSCMKHGYRLSLQLHKLVDLP